MLGLPKTFDLLSGAGMALIVGPPFGLILDPRRNQRLFKAEVGVDGIKMFGGLALVLAI